MMNPEHRKNVSAAKVAAVLPAYESAATVAEVLNSIPREFFQYIILVDDHSRDRTFEIASKDKSILVYRNEKNLGYGGNIKKCFHLALELGVDIIVEIHPDGEYGLESIGPAIDEIKRGAGLVLGNRFVTDGGPLKNGMYFWKYPVIKALNGAGNWALGTRLGDLHQGFRVYSSALLKNIDFNNNSDDYIFSFQLIAQAVLNKFSIREVPESCRYRGKKRGCRLGSAIVYSCSVFGVIIQFLLARLGLPTRLFRNSDRGRDMMGGQSMASEKTKESQYRSLLEIKEQIGLVSLGLMTNQVWHDDPRRLLFVLSRYKFVAKMLSGKKHVLEIGCGDAFATRIVAQEVGRVCAVDFDPVFIKDVKARMLEKFSFDCLQHDILSGPVSGSFDAAYSLDVIEHILKQDEDVYMRNIACSLDDQGVFIIGTPTIQSQIYASRQSKEGHVNCKDQKELKELMARYFQNVFIFSMNDELVHTGFYPMAHYLFAIGVGKQ